MSKVKIIYVGKNDGMGQVQGLIYIRPHAFNWLAWKAHLAQKAYGMAGTKPKLLEKKGSADFEKTWQQNIRVYLHPYGQNLEQDECMEDEFYDILQHKDVVWVDPNGGAFQRISNTINMLPCHATSQSEMDYAAKEMKNVDEVEVLEASTIRDIDEIRKSDGSRKVEEQQDGIERERNNEVLLEQRSMEDFFQHLIDTSVHGYLLSAVHAHDIEEGESLQTVPNEFTDIKGEKRRQYQVLLHEVEFPSPSDASIIDDEVKGMSIREPRACCVICPSFLRNKSETSIEELKKHSKTKWHKRYLSWLLTGRSEFRPSLSLLERYAQDRLAKEELFGYPEYITHLKQKKKIALTYGYHVNLDQLPEQQKRRLHKKVVTIQTFFRQIKFRQRYRNRAQKQQQLKATSQLLEQKTQDKEYVWKKMVRDLCQHCTESMLCREHAEGLALLTQKGVDRKAT